MEEQKKLNLNGLSRCASIYAQGSRLASTGHWIISRGSQDLLFEVLYDNQAVAGYFENKGFDNYDNMNEVIMKRLMHIICLQMPNLIEKDITNSPMEKDSEELEY
jgi:hypothetical protein